MCDYYVFYSILPDGGSSSTENIITLVVIGAVGQKPAADGGSTTKTNKFWVYGIYTLIIT